ncbi:hypothetical protein QTA58_23430 [Neorhizobium sp. CSC1952]|uniref:DUF6650 family protein n=1 Tax=Neorhizobium sp. CSC1952 TaxID=2978974 RepID=UPI0025A5243B|nr:DUF6650 family protein [Rhizobium sp. CSC1952]WJR67094.1 hypothetical protein QTA58_23430 [Rhizobium sp. CSC1952]
MLIRAKEMLKRVTGISTPLFGVSWNPPASDRDAVRKFLAFLEDRRALFNPLPAEVEDHVISSIHMIRAECTTTVGTLSDKAAGAVHIRAIGAACRRFLDEPYPTLMTSWSSVVIRILSGMSIMAGCGMGRIRRRSSPPWENSGVLWGHKSPCCQPSIRLISMVTWYVSCPQ